MIIIWSSSLKIGGWGQGWPLCSGPRVPLYKKGHSKNVPLYKMLCTLFPSTKWPDHTPKIELKNNKKPDSFIVGTGGFSTKWCQNWIRSPVCIPQIGFLEHILCRGTTWYNSPFPYCPLRWCHNIISLWFTLPFQQACDRPWWSKSSSFIICRYLSYMLFIIFCWIPCHPYSSFFILFHPPSN